MHGLTKGNDQNQALKSSNVEVKVLSLALHLFFVSFVLYISCLCVYNMSV